MRRQSHHARPRVSPLATTDIGDVWRWSSAPQPGTERTAGRQRFLVIAPTIGSKPTTGLTAGVNGNMAFFCRRSGDDASRRCRADSGSPRKSRFCPVCGIPVFTANDRWFVQGDNRFSWTSQNTYGLGTDTIRLSAENVKNATSSRCRDDLSGVRHGLFVGGGLIVNVHDDIRPGEGAENGAGIRSACVQCSRRTGSRRIARPRAAPTSRSCSSTRGTTASTPSVDGGMQYPALPGPFPTAFWAAIPRFRSCSSTPRTLSAADKRRTSSSRLLDDEAT